MEENEYINGKRGDMPAYNEDSIEFRLLKIYLENPTDENHDNFITEMKKTDSALALINEMSIVINHNGTISNEKKLSLLEEIWEPLKRVIVKNNKVDGSGRTKDEILYEKDYLLDVGEPEDKDVLSR